MVTHSIRYYLHDIYICSIDARHSECNSMFILTLMRHDWWEDYRNFKKEEAEEKHYSPCKRVSSRGFLRKPVLKFSTIV